MVWQVYDLTNPLPQCMVTFCFKTMAAERPRHERTHLIGRLLGDDGASRGWCHHALNQPLEHYLGFITVAR